jgi:hypothetical protein
MHDKIRTHSVRNIDITASNEYDGTIATREADANESDKDEDD